ncbi:TetR family transcriptional regulator [Crenobacter sp. SG2303]|uniref:TetR family transcriptional regulator n=1 Tax=Crenobacter oryzisoli TaxID=3056844 RepID=A0ABT7XS42_9NEIS|nr:TetR family transcriptional regulator [Crenobacter sp. SG2303]MDN0076605.1 TetR family transcriptional regulator [Crenobacter sp. SG2303]
MTPALRRIHQAALRLFAERGDSQITIRDLAEAAGIARGTVYNNLAHPETLLEDVAAQLVDEMQRRVVNSMEMVEDPVQRLAFGMRFFIRRAHEEPEWGRFFMRFAFSNATLREVWTGAPTKDLEMGLEQGRYKISTDQLLSVVAMVAGSVLGAMLLVQEGYKTWREAGSDTTQLLLMGLGVDLENALSYAGAELPPLLPL